MRRWWVRVLVGILVLILVLVGVVFVATNTDWGRERIRRYAEKTLQYLFQIWGRPVHLESILEGDRVLFSYDGSKNIRTEL